MRSRQNSLTVVWWILAGCAGPGPATKFVECPLTVEEQQQAVLEIVPAGTSREDAVRRLKAAGFESSPGGSGSIYYVPLWKRPDGENWHMNVALLFDGSGRLYRARAANASTEPAGVSDLPGNESAVDRPQSASGPAPSVSARRDVRPAATNGDEAERVPFPGQRQNARSTTP